MFATWTGWSNRSKHDDPGMRKRLSMKSGPFDQQAEKAPPPKKTKPATGGAVDVKPKEKDSLDQCEKAPPPKKTKQATGGGQPVDVKPKRE